MKKIVSLIVILIVLSGCTNEISTPAPGFQAFKDDSLWRAEDMKAYIYPDGHLRLVGLMQNEKLELTISDTDTGSYYLASTDTENRAEFITPFNDEVLHYLTYDAAGPLKINNPILTGGTGYSEAFSVATTTLNGGVGLRVNTTVSDTGAITGVIISSNGSGYEPGDIITITGGSGTAKFKISSEIKITGFTETGISGTFRFTAKNAFSNPFVNELVSFQSGAFYNVPITFVN